MNIAIIKYGMGNIASVQKAIDRLGYRSVITDNPKEIKQADFIILPGVGSFAKAMENLQKSGLDSILTQEVVKNKKPFIGICLGMQLLATYGNEPGNVKGLGWIDGEVVKIKARTDLRVPHLGWNDIKITENNKKFYKEFDGLDYYFIHSYHFEAKDKKDVVLTVKYGAPMVAALQKRNIYATQFHPEKSQNAGTRLLKKIIDQYA